MNRSNLNPWSRTIGGSLTLWLALSFVGACSDDDDSDGTGGAGGHSGGTSSGGKSNTTGGRAPSGGTTNSGGVGGNAVQVSARGASSCALLSDGSVRCWGSNDRGQLGNGTFNASSVPTAVSALDHVVQLAHINGLCGLSTTPGNREFYFPVSQDYGAACALRADASVWCWGAVPSADPELEEEVPVVTSAVPVKVLDGVRQISAGQDHTCLLLSSGQTKCWGIFHRASTDVSSWRAPSNDEMCESFVLEVPSDTVQLADGASAACALSADGSVACGNLWLSLGRGERSDTGTGLAKVRGITNAVQIAMGRGHACAALADGGIQCWGLDEAGQLGVGHIYTNYPSGLAEPVSVVGFP